MVNNIHPFESAGLGTAPFRYLGCETRVGPLRYVERGVEVEVGSPGQPMGTCALCGMGIKYCHMIKGSCGTMFVVGSDCVEKLRGVEDVLPQIQEAVKLARKRERAEKARVLREERAAARERDAKARKAEIYSQFLAANPGILDALAVEGNPFVAQMREKLESFGSLTERQVKAVMDLYRVRQMPKAAAPSGRVDVRCRLVAVKAIEEWCYGRLTTRLLATLEGGDEAGVWRAWGTLPSSIPSDYRGEVDIRATFNPKPNAAHEAWFSRPTGKVLS